MSRVPPARSMGHGAVDSTIIRVAPDGIENAKARNKEDANRADLGLSVCGAPAARYVASLSQPASSFLPSALLRSQSLGRASEASVSAPSTGPARGATGCSWDTPAPKHRWIHSRNVEHEPMTLPDQLQGSGSPPSPK